MSIEQWAVPELSKLLPLDQAELQQIVAYAASLDHAEATAHLETLLGDNLEALHFVEAYSAKRAQADNMSQNNGQTYSAPPYPPPADIKQQNGLADPNRPQAGKDSMFHPGTGVATNGANGANGVPAYAPPPGLPPPTTSSGRPYVHNHTNQVIEAGKLRAKDELQMQNTLQTIQLQYNIYNPEIEPEHESDYYCNCAAHNWQRLKYNRIRVLDQWAAAVMYPGEKSYNDAYYRSNTPALFSSNPYQMTYTSPYGQFNSNWGNWGVKRPVPSAHATWIHQTITINNRENKKAQETIDAKEPQVNIWEDLSVEKLVADMKIGDPKSANGKYPNEKRQSIAAPPTPVERPKQSKFSSFRQSIGIKTSDEKVVSKATKKVSSASTIRNQILQEEQGRWPDQEWREIVMNYQAKVGMTNKIAALRARQPIQYLHLLRAGYFEPIPVAWAQQNSNPLKFTIDGAGGWRGITPAWRGYEDTAEERLYWVLNHREGPAGMRMKPDFISEMDMARARMAKAVEPPPQYFSPNDTCHLQHTSEGYSKQVMPSPFRAFDRPEVSSDDTMILLDVSGSMDFDPVRPNYNQYLITSYARSTQPKNKDVAKAIVRRFTDAMQNHDHEFNGYDLVTFSSAAQFIGTVTHQNLEDQWKKVKLGGGTRVMTGWQMVKERHFQKHSESATHHPVYGWQAGAQTPMLRLLLLLDGEATDMDEFELDLLGLSWAHVTIFLIGVDGCPHHHRHANELQRISDVNHHVSFVDAQGNTPERFVTHELLKRHLGEDITMQQFEQMEQLPAYSEMAPGTSVR